ncbi:hypothetical protein SBRCBS47491_010165 [Sporothrix bragantina]|uniref:NmrA-like domain-containing protein n=1 Tax=Sporothrix bragantina TaxID=671064 RepID=A0ABP0D090_9PEZI
MPPKTFLITAATGRQGGAAARLLLKQGKIVHALVRDVKSPASRALQKLGVILFEGDFCSTDVIKDATRGIDGIFLNLFPTQEVDKQGEQAQVFIDAAKAAGATSIVASTVFNTSRPQLWQDREGMNTYYRGKSIVEDVVRNAGLESYTILRPPTLMHNFLKPDAQWHYPELATEGILAHAFEAYARTPYLDAADVGQFAVAALLDPGLYNGHEIDLCAQNLTIDEVAGVLSRVSGRTILARRRSAEELAEKKDMLPTLPFQIMANEVDLSIDAEALTTKYHISMTTLEEFMEREKVALLQSLTSL